MAQHVVCLLRSCLCHEDCSNNAVNRRLSTLDPPSREIAQEGREIVDL